MTSTSLTRNNIQEIEDVLSVYVPELKSLTIKRAIRSLQFPIINYVNTYVPEEYNDDFEYMDTWESMIKDIMYRGSLELSSIPSIPSAPSSSVKFESSPIVTPVKKIISELPLEESLPAYVGPLMLFKDKRVTFRIRVAIVLMILILLSLVEPSDSSRQVLTEFVLEEQESFVKKVISGYMTRQKDDQDESFIKRDEFGRMIA